MLYVLQNMNVLRRWILRGRVGLSTPTVCLHRQPGPLLPYCWPTTAALPAPPCPSPDGLMAIDKVQCNPQGEAESDCLCDAPAPPRGCDGQQLPHALQTGRVTSGAHYRLPQAVMTAAHPRHRSTPTPTPWRHQGLQLWAQYRLSQQGKVLRCWTVNHQTKSNKLLCTHAICSGERNHVDACTTWLQYTTVQQPIMLVGGQQSPHALQTGRVTSGALYGCRRQQRLLPAQDTGPHPPHHPDKHQGLQP